MNGELRRVFKWPLCLAVATVIGLISALLADDLWDAVSWVGLGLPVLLATLKLSGKLLLKF